MKASTQKRPLDKSISFILSYLRGHRKTLAFGAVLVALTTFFQLLPPLVLRYGIEYMEWRAGSTQAALPPWLHDRLAPHSPLFSLGCFAAATVLLAAIQGVFRYFMRNILIGTSRKIEYELRNDYLQHLQTLSASFFQRNKTGDLMARATNDMEAIRSMLGPGIMQFASTIVIGLVSILLMAGISLKTTLWSLLPMPFVAVIVYRQVGQIERLFDRIQAQFSALTAKVQENLSGIRVIKSYVQETHEIDHFCNQSKEYVRRNMKLVRVRASMWATIEFLLGITTLTALWVGGRQVMTGALSIGGLVAFLAYLAMLAWPMIAFGWVLNLWQEGLASTGRILAILRQAPEIGDDQRTDHTLTTVAGRITFRDLSFAYAPAGPFVLKHIDLDIQAGMTLAIVGATGSGKSTLVNLIPRLQEAPEGTLLIDGRPIRHFPLHILRRHIGMVPQETFLFSDTLQDNIAFGEEGAELAAIENAAAISQIKSDFDQFPDGYATVVGERGITLSGGQKQRTAISRAVIRQPAILILDDALSAVDTYTEEEILKRLRTVMRDRTTILVSHRISTVRDADLIIVLREGEIIERGCHEELLAQRGVYYELNQRQMLEESLAAMG